MRLATADFGWPLLPHDRVLRLIGLLDIEAVDLGLFAGRSHIRPETVRQDIPMWAGVLKERLERAGLELADLFVQGAPTFAPLAINNPDRPAQEEASELFVDMLELARRLGAPGMTILPGVRFGEESWEASIRRSAEALRWRVDAAAEHGIALSVEGHVGSNVDTPEKLADLLDLTPGLTLTLDYTHFTYAGIPDHEVEPLLAQARHFHCRGAAPGRLQTPFAENTIDYRRVIQRLHELRYGGYFAIEYVWIDWEGCNRTENTCETILFRDLAREAMLPAPPPPRRCAPD
ncbi:MAG TPA: TIM barrel protein [Chloroflexota bacterium]|jgi:sugar phosphate isomerase/epimerase|nr:TIM barrel protein [Chloroflexota bacterium]